jgi:AI-2 transport protein TqsA
VGKTSTPQRIVLMIAALAIILGAMKAAAGVLVPGLLALFIAIVCTEPMYWMINKGLPRGFAILLMVLALLGLSSVVPLVISGSYIQFTQELPLYQERADLLLVQSSEWLTDFGYDVDSVRAIVDPAAALGYVQVVLAALGGILSRYFLIMLLVIFILVDVPRFSQDSKSTAGEIIRTVQHYFAIKTFTSMLTGLLIAAWLLLLDVQYPWLWGFLAFLLNFVPNIGSVLAAIPAVILSLLFDGATTALIVLLGYGVINIAVSNGLEPRIMGQQLGLKFVWIFVSLIFWGWILGPVGMLLAVPLTMTVRIIAETHANTQWVARVLMPDTQQLMVETADASPEGKEQKFDHESGQEAESRVDAR